MDGIYFGGGYPELHAGRLADNASLRRAVADAGRDGMPIYAECGGFMYLCKELRDRDGRAHPMCGCFPFTAEMQPRLRTLGYREIRLRNDTLLGEKIQLKVDMLVLILKMSSSSSGRES